MNLLYCLRRAKQMFGERPASYHADGRVFSWAEFYERAHRSAAVLRDCGVEPGDRVAVWLLNSHEYTELYYSTLIAGAVIVPLNTRWNYADVSFTLADSGSKVLVVDDRFAPDLPHVLPEAQCVTTILNTGTKPVDGTIAYEVAVNAADRAKYQWLDGPDEEIAGLFYTSGTTGGPKGVMLTHRNIYANAIHGMIGQETGPERVWLHAAPMFHLADGSVLHLWTMQGRAHTYLASFDPEGVLRAIEKYRVTNLVLVPTMLNALLNCPALGRYDISSLKEFLYGASPMPLPLLRQAAEKLKCRFRQGYGMTEASPVITYLEHEDHDLDEPETDTMKAKSGGRAAYGVEVRVVDEQNNDVPVGQSGEIVARGDVVMKGYWNRPEITAETLRNGWLHTGDLGRFDHRGFLFILDRKKDMIKPGGENVYSPEVEAMLLAHPAVLEAAVIGVPDVKWMEAIRAVVVLRPGQEVTASELIAFCRERLTHFKCPTSVVFTDVLPKGGTGKVQKVTLRKLYGSAIPNV